MRVAILSFEFPPATPLGGISTYSAQLADMLITNMVRIMGNIQNGVPVNDTLDIV